MEINDLPLAAMRAVMLNGSGSLFDFGWLTHSRVQ